MITVVLFNPGHSMILWNNRFSIQPKCFFIKQQLSTVIRLHKHPLGFPSLIYFCFQQYLLSPSQFPLPYIWFIHVKWYVWLHFSVHCVCYLNQKRQIGLVHSFFSFPIRSPHNHFSQELRRHLWTSSSPTPPAAQGSTCFPPSSDIHRYW